MKEWLKIISCYILLMLSPFVFTEAFVFVLKYEQVFLNAAAVIMILLCFYMCASE